MKLEVKYSSKFKKGLKLAAKRGLDISLLENVVEIMRSQSRIVKNLADGCIKEYKEDIEKRYVLAFEKEKGFLDRVNLRPRMSRYYPLYAILLNTGLRISEAIGLTWDYVD